MLRNFFIFYAFFLVLVLTVFGLRGCKSERTPIEIFPDMDHQARFHPQGASDFFSDGRMDRPGIPGRMPFITSEQEQFPHLMPDTRYREDSYVATGKRGSGDEFGDGIPVGLTESNMRHGRELYQIYCAICHGDSGDGGGVLAAERYGYPTIVSLLQQRLIDQSDGEMFEIITNGRGTMGAYGSKIRVEDRWKVIMYVRALQRASQGSVDDVPAARRGELDL
ncbi:MAG: cytochrome c [Opitutales bacterium]|nr:cytochrome c [Opitutales bacterium]